jgi:hypothetical protein
VIQVFQVTPAISPPATQIESLAIQYMNVIFDNLSAMPFGLRIITKNLYVLCEKYSGVQLEICKSFLFEQIWIQCLTASNLFTPILAVDLTGTVVTCLDKVCIWSNELLKIRWRKR